MGSLILARHATTDAAATGRNLGRRTDAELTPEGHKVARRLGAALREELAELPHQELRLVSSPALRCRQTAAAIAAALDVPGSALETDDRLWEIDYGAWDGLTSEECALRDPELRARWEADPYGVACPDGESGAAVAARAFAALGPIEAWLADDRARCAIVVAHNHVNRLRICALFGWPMTDYRRRVTQDPGAYSLVAFGAEMPIVRRINAAAWLPAEPSGARPPETGTQSA
jgi:probable phosphoglycerate mutase